MNSNKRICAYVNLENLKKNVSTIKNILNRNTKIMAVVKADGYGLGAVPVAKYISTIDYIYGFAVATIEEGVALREAGISKPILILGYTFPEDFPEMIRNDISTAVVSYKMAYELSKMASRMNRSAGIHIKIDTGMGRIGFPADDATINDIINISKLTGVHIDGVFTHFAKADENDLTYTRNQFELFESMVKKLKAKGVDTGLAHCSNSAAAVDFHAANLDMVRLGIFMYGMWPSGEITRDLVQPNPVLSLRSHISFVKDVPAGTSISYGGTFVADKDMKIATVPVGYADGYPRSLSGKGYVLVRGSRLPIVGRICMDQFMVDATGTNVNVGDMVTLVGSDGKENITMEKLGELSGRFNYELSCDLNQRIPRVYK